MANLATRKPLIVYFDIDTCCKLLHNCNMNHIVNMKVLNDWIKERRTPALELAFRADVAEGTVRKLFKGECPKTKKVRSKISGVIGVDEDTLFPLEVDRAA